MNRIHSLASDKGPIQFEWQTLQGNFIAVGGCKGSVTIYDKLGALMENFTMDGEIVSMQWTDNGDILAVISSKSGVINFWDAKAKTLAPSIDTSFPRGLCHLKWSKTGRLLAIGMTKGNLILFDRSAGTITPILGRHSKAIIDAVWDDKSRIFLASEDETFSMTDASGTEARQISVNGVPRMLSAGLVDIAKSEWVAQIEDNMDQPFKSTLRFVVSMVINGKNMLFHNPAVPKLPIELTFSTKYGEIIKYHWLDNGQMLIGFTNGTLLLISTNLVDIGHEQVKVRNYKDSMNDVSVCQPTNQVATVGDSSIKIQDLADIKDISAIIEIVDQRGNLDKIQWSPDGQFLSVSTKDGSLLTYLCKIPDITGVWGSQVIYTTSLNDIKIADQSKLPNYERGSVSTDIMSKTVLNEPICIAVGPHVMATAAGCVCHYYQLHDLESSRPWEMEYSSPIKGLALNGGFVAIFLAEGRVLIQNFGKHEKIKAKGPAFVDDSTYYAYMNGLELDYLESQLTFTKISKKLPEEHAGTATCFALTPYFLVIGTSQGLILHYDLPNLTIVNEIKHTAPIKSVFPQPGNGVRLVFVDQDEVGFIATPTSKAIMIIPDWPANSEKVLWETLPVLGRTFFTTQTSSSIVIYSYDAMSCQGGSCVSIGTMRRPFGMQPVLMRDGVLSCQTSTGKLELLHLTTHKTYSPVEFLKKFTTEETQVAALQLMYSVGKINDLWDLRTVIKSRRIWTMIAEIALQRLDIKFAKKIYSELLKDAGTVMYLDRVAECEDLNELTGHICVLFREFDNAQDFFMRSSNPLAALELRRDLMQWEEAIQLATRIYPDIIPVLSREHAQQLEFKERYGDALTHFEQALSTQISEIHLDMSLQEHRKICIYGLIRNALRQGDVLRGMSMLKEIDDKILLLECGNILFDLKQYQDASVIFQHAEQWERAADCLIRIKNWTALGSILGKIKSTKVHVQYARAKEAEGLYTEASNAYERGKDFDNVVRIQVDFLKNIDAAVSVVRLTRSPQSAKLVSKYFQNSGEYLNVIEFMVMAGMQNEAYDVAQLHDQMEFFGDLVRKDASKEMLMNIVSYFQNRNKPFQAAQYLYYAEEYPKALAAFLVCPFQEEIVDFAIETVGKARQDPLTHSLIDWLMGETDGIPKDAKYIFRLYMSLGQYKEAGRTAVIIAREEQNLGNYRAARDLLFDSYQQLEASGNKIPSDLNQMLLLLHSYSIVKTLVKFEDHELAARMLIRVSNHISKFPSHTVPILTSAVIECHKAGLKKSAYEFAATLMRPEYRPKLDEKYARKIEQIIRRPEDGEVVPSASPCPFCNHMLPDTALDCNECQNRIPYCIFTGRHMVNDDWCACPNCKFPALFSRLKALLAKAPQCPMCYAKIDERDVVKIDDPRNLLEDNIEQVDGGAKDNAKPTTVPVKSTEALNTPKLVLQGDSSSRDELRQSKMEKKSTDTFAKSTDTVKKSAETLKRSKDGLKDDTHLLSPGYVNEANMLSNSREGLMGEGPLKRSVSQYRGAPAQDDEDDDK